ncbi:MAG: UDP-glucuronic acid decarboxylase family protein [Sandaracinaceae bacterium]
MASLRCLVTGGAGFVGSHLVDRLLAEGHRVVALDNFVTGFRRNVEHLAQQSRFTLVEHDVTRPFPSLGAFDQIFNLACPASPPHYQRDPIFTTLTCVHGALHCLEAAAASGARMLQASTSEVYGDPRVHPQPETYRGFVSPVGPRACYDEGKRVAETLSADFRRRRTVDVRIARIFNTYGPRMDPGDGRVVSNFAVQAIRGEPLTVYGDGMQTRSFCYVDDLVDGMMRLMRHEGRDPFVVNLGNDGEYTMLELARLILDKTSSTSELTHRPLPADDPVRRRPDLTVARTHLGYEPRVALAQGLDSTLAYFSRVV